MAFREGRLVAAAPAELRRQVVATGDTELFGGFAIDPFRVPTTDEEIAHKRNAMAFVEGNYPLSIGDCEVVGISGGCGEGCPILKRGACETQAEMEPALAQLDLNRLSRAWLRDCLQAAMEMR